jgi:cytochrome c553
LQEIKGEGMTRQPRNGRPGAWAPWGAAALALALGACGGGGEPTTAQTLADSGPTETAAAVTSAVVLATATPPPAGRLLASNCFQCHGTGGTGGFEEIRGKSANELLEYQRKSASGNIMAAHIQGYTPEQLNQIAAYLK